MVADCYFHVWKILCDKATLLGSFYLAVMAAVRELANLPSPQVHHDKKGEAITDWVFQGVPEMFTEAFRKENLGTSWRIATLPAGYPTPNNNQEGINSDPDFVPVHTSSVSWLLSRDLFSDGEWSNDIFLAHFVCNAKCHPPSCTLLQRLTAIVINSWDFCIPTHPFYVPVRQCPPAKVIQSLELRIQHIRLCIICSFFCSFCGLPSQSQRSDPCTHSGSLN